VIYTAKLPEEEGYQVVVLFLPSPNAEKNFRIELSHISVEAHRAPTSNMPALSNPAPLKSHFASDQPG